MASSVLSGSAARPGHQARQGGKELDRGTLPPAAATVTAELSRGLSARRRGTWRGPRSRWVPGASRQGREDPSASGKARERESESERRAREEGERSWACVSARPRECARGASGRPTSPATRGGPARTQANEPSLPPLPLPGSVTGEPSLIFNSFLPTPNPRAARVPAAPRLPPGRSCTTEGGGRENGAESAWKQPGAAGEPLRPCPPTWFPVGEGVGISAGGGGGAWREGDGCLDEALGAEYEPRARRPVGLWFSSLRSTRCGLARKDRAGGHS